MTYHFSGQLLGLPPLLHFLRSSLSFLCGCPSHLLLLLCLASCVFLHVLPLCLLCLDLSPPLCELRHAQIVVIICALHQALLRPGLDVLEIGHWVGSDAEAQTRCNRLYMPLHHNQQTFKHQQTSPQLDWAGQVPRLTVTSNKVPNWLVLDSPGQPIPTIRATVLTH